MAVFRVAWINPENPAKGAHTQRTRHPVVRVADRQRAAVPGFKYLYVTPADYQLLVQGGKASLRATLLHDDGEDRCGPVQAPPPPCAWLSYVPLIGQLVGTSLMM